MRDGAGDAKHVQRTAAAEGAPELVLAHEAEEECAHGEAEEDDEHEGARASHRADLRF